MIALSDKNLAVLNDPARIAARDAWLRRLEGVFAGLAVEGVFDLGGYGCGGAAQVSVIADPERWIAEVLADLASRADLIMDKAVFRPLVVRPFLYRVHFVDAVLGAEAFDLDGTGNWQAHPLKTPVGALVPPDLDANLTWRRAREMAEAFLAADVVLPLFETPTLSSPLNIALNLYGGEFLVSMLTDPEAARRDLRVITDLIVTMHRWYIDHVPVAQLQAVAAYERCQPPGYGQICGCSTHLISRQQYADFIAPLDEEILSVYPHGGMIHLCGAHAQHIPTFRAMRSLRAVQINNRAAEDLPAYFAGLRDDQILYVNLFPGMPWRRVLEITGGRRVVTIGPRSDEGKTKGA